MQAFLKDFRLQATVLALIAFVAGKFSYVRLIPMPEDLPYWATEVRLPFLIAATTLAGLAWFKRGERPLMVPSIWTILAAFAVYSFAYVFLPFPLTERADIIFGTINVLLFAGLAHPRLLAPIGHTFIAISTGIIIATFALMPFTDGFLFAGMSSTFVKILAVSIFLLLCRKGSALNYFLLALNIIALIFSIQISSIVALLVAVAAIPVLFVCGAFETRSLTINLIVALVAVFIGCIGNYTTIKEKIAYRMKYAEVEEVFRNSGNIKAKTFPGGLYSTEVMRNGEAHKILIPNLQKDPRVCIDDRSDRIKLYAHGLLLYSQSPDRWGWGDGAFLMKLTNYGITQVHKHPHNIFLEVLITRGIYFLLAFIVIVYAGVIKVFVAAYRAPETAPFVISMAYILTASQWSGDYFDFRWFFMLMVPVLVMGFGKTRSGDL